MKNVVLSFAIALVLLNGSATSAQIVTQANKDTAMASYTGGADVTVYNPIKSGSSDSVVLRWNVITGSTKLDPGWSANGVCDNNVCYSGTVITNGILKTSNPYKNDGYTGLAHDFHVIFDVDNNMAANGSSGVIRINASDLVSSSSRTLTFIGYKGTLGVSNISSTDEVVLFPNPARDAVNVIYDEKAGVKTIAVYNLIGKLMGPIYKPSSNSSAKIDLDDMPTGIYFLRLMNSRGNVVATRRFTRL